MSNPKYVQLLRHMLGADSRYKKKTWGCRNHFCASEGYCDFDALMEMEKAGLVRSLNRFDSISFKITKSGAIYIGFKDYQLRKVFPSVKKVRVVEHGN